MAWKLEALRCAIRAAGGYPYFVQQCGFCICEQFAGPARMGKSSTSDLSVLRDRLIEDGLIFAPERGMVAFTVPGMDDFIRRMSE